MLGICNRTFAICTSRSRIFVIFSPNMLSNLARWSLIVAIIATSAAAFPVFAKDKSKREDCNIAGSLAGVINDLINDLGQIFPLIGSIGKDVTTIASTLFADGGCGTAVVSCISTLISGGETCGSLAACTSLLGNTGFIAVVADALSKVSEIAEDALQLTGEIPFSCFSEPAITAIWPALDFTMDQVSNFGKGVIQIATVAEKKEISLANSGFELFVNKSTEIIENTIGVAKPIISHAPFFNATLVDSLDDLESVLDSLKNSTASIF